MNEAKHTPGPWTVDGISVTACESVGKPRATIATAHPHVYLPSWASIEMMRANARLIAAAPDLYAALDDLIELCRPNIYPQPDRPDSPYAKLEAARLAIAKARGEA